MTGSPQDAQPATLALRFRDLSIRDTVEAHNVIAREHGYVWWGWWNKPDERTPREVFASLMRRIKDTGEPVEIFLVDSGHDLLYTARLEEIVVAPGLQEDERALTPEPERTPAYYRETPYRVWFKFRGEIEERPPSTIREFSYDEVPEEVFVADPHQHRYDGKRVESLQEMLSRRHRTIYFLRTFAEGDKEGELQFEAPDEPKSFQLQPVIGSSDYILLLSDLHFSDGGQHQFALRADVGEPDLFNVIKEDIDAHFPDRPPTAIIVSGDLTWHGSADEFEHARTFLSRLKSAWSLDWSQFVIVPGNHDITWLTDDHGGAGRPAVAEAEGAYRRFFAQALRFNAPEELSLGRRYLLDTFVPVDVVGVNSCRLERDEYRGYGYVGLEQLRRAFDAMGWGKGSEPGPKVRVLVLHHHVVPVVPREKLGATNYSLTLDAGELLYTALEYGVDLIVHGHQHKPFVAGFSRYVETGDIPRGRTVVIHGAGSVGVATPHLPAGVGNAYSILRFDHKGLNISIRERSAEHGSAFRESWMATLTRTPHGFRAESEA
jgi:3',5'-cyclic AMP phosphodiesterase CpdA